MGKFSTVSKAAAVAVLGATLFVGCGTDATTSSSSSGVGGVVPKGYLSGASVWLDLNGDSIQDAAEVTTTNSSGAYSFSSSPTGTPIMQASGGIDTDSGTAFEGVLKAPFETGATNVVISPITTMVAAIVEQGETVASAKAKAVTALGVALDKLTVDPIAEAKSSSGDTNVTKASLKIARLVEFIAKKSGGVAANYGSVVSSIATQMNTASADLNASANTVATANGVSTATVNVLSNAIDNMTITAGASAADIKAAEMGTKLAVEILDKNSSATFTVNNLVQVVAGLITQTDANSSLAIDVNATANTLQALDLSGTIDVNSTVATTASTALVDKAAYEAAQAAAAAQAKIDAAKAVDKLKLKDNQVIIGQGDQQVTATINSNALFSEISHATVATGDIANVYALNFELENVTDGDGNAYESLEDGDDKNVTIALKIEDGGSNKKLLAVLKDVSLTRVDGDSNTSNYNGEYTIAINSNTKLNAYAVKTDGSKIATSNVALTADSVSSSSGVVTANIGAIVSQLESDSTFASSITDIKNNFTQNGSYTVSAYISGIDGVVNSALSSTANVYSGFEDYNSSISGLFSGKVSKISGTVNIGLTAAEILALNTTAVATAKAACTLSSNTPDLTSSISLPSAGSEGTTITWATSDASVISATGAITRTETQGSATLTATISKGSGSTLATDTKTFSVTVAANPASATNSSLYPSTASTYFGGTAVTLTAIVMNETNSSMADKVVSFSGATLGDLNASTCTTNSSGYCSVGYTPDASGTDGNDTISATVSSNGQTITVGTAEIAVTSNPLAAVPYSAADNTGSVVSYTMSAGVNVAVLSSADKVGQTSNGTVAIYGTVDGTSTGANLKLNDGYSNGTAFIVRVYDDSNNTIGTSSSVVWDGSASYDFGAITTN